MKKKTTSKKKSPTPPKKGGRAPELKGIILIFLALGLFLSLISYNAEDPSWVSTAGQKTQNYLGKVGASLAEGMLQLLGIAAFILPLAFFYLGIQSFFPKIEKQLLKKLLYVGFVVLIICPLLFILVQNISWRGEVFKSGGFIGELVASFLIRFFNHTGSALLLAGALILLLFFSTRVSFQGVFHLLAKMFRFVFKEVRIRITHYRKEKHRQKMRQRVAEKYSEPRPKTTPPPAAPVKLDPAEQEKTKKEKKKKASRKKKPEPVIVSRPENSEIPLFPDINKKSGYSFPPLTLLDLGKQEEKIDKNELYEKKQTIEEKFLQFRVEGEVREYHPGPIVTTYEYYPHPHIKVSQVVNLSEDLSLALGAESVRIQRIPGKSSIGLEIPNNKREIIKLRDVLQTEKFVKSPSKLTIALGKSIHGEPYITDLAVMPHLLIAGATGTGKSVALNTIIASILYKATPDEVKIILIDPKRIEFSLYDGIPHLLCPVVKEPRKAEAILLDAITKMEERYQTLGYLKVRNIEQFNQQVKKLLKAKGSNLTDEEKEKLQPLPYIVIIIDELAELMMVGAKEVEYCIARLAQLARAVGIHLVMATQRPSTDVITGTIKNNFASRIAFRVPSKIDSRVILDGPGADKLLGKGDMLFMPPNFPRVIRLHSSFISLPEVTRLLKFVKEQGKPEYDEKIIKVLKRPIGQVESETGDRDPLFEKAVELVLLTGQASASYLQRKLKLGYARASRIIDQMESEGIVGPSEGSKPRAILVNAETYFNKNNL